MLLILEVINAFTVIQEDTNEQLKKMVMYNSVHEHLLTEVYNYMTSYMCTHNPYYI